MRVVGYVREASDPREGEPAFAQSERIRRWANDGGHVLVAICQDLRSADTAGRWEGFRAVLGIVDTDVARAVVVSDLTVLSPDKIVQEIVIRDLRSRDATVISVNEKDHADLEEATADRVRMVVRDVLTRLDEHDKRFAKAGKAARHAPVNDFDGEDVIIELISPEPPQPVERIRPVR